MTQINSYPQKMIREATDNLLVSEVNGAYKRIQISDFLDGVGDGSVAPWKYINSNYSASGGDRLMIDSSSVKPVITLPYSPHTGQEVELSIIRGSGVSFNLNQNKYLGENPDIISFNALKIPAKMIYESLANGWFFTSPDIIAAKLYYLEIAENAPWVYYRLSDANGTTVIDVSGNNRSGTYRGGVTLQQTGGISYENNKAILLNGTTGYISFPASITPPNTFSFECMFKTSSASGSLFGFSNSQLTGGGSFDRELYLTSGKLRFYVYNGNSQYLDTPLAYNDNKWHIVTATMSSLGMRIFVDGALKASNSVSSGASYTAFPHIGYSVSGGFFNGLIDEPNICIATIPSDAKIIRQHFSALA